jgi:hypothetical protein
VIHSGIPIMAATIRAIMGKLAITMPVTASLLGSFSPAAAPAGF